jgi:hypothetical protein
MGMLALVGLVAVAATGSTPSGSGSTRRPGDEFLDTILSLWLVAFVVGAAMLVYTLLTQRRRIAQERAKRRRRRELAFFLVLLGLTMAAFLEGAHRRLHPLGGRSQGGAGRPVLPEGRAPGVRDYHAQFAWIPVLVIVGLVGAAFLAWSLAVRRRQAERSTRQTVAETLGDVIEETLDDLAFEPDPRRAVIACYARLERALAAGGFPRRRAETQQEHLARILGGLDIDTCSIRRLNDLFTRAKFSHHDIDIAMKEEAIAALVAIREDLHASEARRRGLETSLASGAVAS